MKLSIQVCLSSFTPSTETKMSLVLNFPSVHNHTIKQKFTDKTKINFNYTIGSFLNWPLLVSLNNLKILFDYLTRLLYWFITTCFLLSFYPSDYLQYIPISNYNVRLLPAGFSMNSSTLRSIALLTKMES